MSLPQEPSSVSGGGGSYATYVAAIDCTFSGRDASSFDVAIDVVALMLACLSNAVATLVSASAVMLAKRSVVLTGLCCWIGGESYIASDSAIVRGYLSGTSRISFSAGLSASWRIFTSGSSVTREV